MDFTIAVYGQFSSDAFETCPDLGASEIPTLDLRDLFVPYEPSLKVCKQ